MGGKTRLAATITIHAMGGVPHVYYRAMNEPELSAFGRGGQDENRRLMIRPRAPPEQVLLIHDSRTLVSRNLRRFTSAELLISTHVPNWALAVSLIHHSIFRQVLIHQNPRALSAIYNLFSKSPSVSNLKSQISNRPLLTLCSQLPQSLPVPNSPAPGCPTFPQPDCQGSSPS